jgi:hypothetical protein
MVKQIYYDGNHQRMHGIKVYNESWLFYLFIAAWAIFQLPGGFTITGDKAANLNILCLALLNDYQQPGFFYVHYLLRHATLVYTVSFEGLAGIRVPHWDSNPQRKNQQIFTQCTMRAT